MCLNACCCRCVCSACVCVYTWCICIFTLVFVYVRVWINNILAKMRQQSYLISKPLKQTNIIICSLSQYLWCAMVRLGLGIIPMFLLPNCVRCLMCFFFKCNITLTTSLNHTVSFFCCQKIVAYVNKMYHISRYKNKIRIKKIIPIFICNKLSYVFSWYTLVDVHNCNFLSGVE